MPNPNFSTLVATTLKNYRRNLADNITNKEALWYCLKEGGFIREDEGGTSIVEPLLIGTNSTVRSYSGYDVLDTSPQAGITAAEYDWKQIAGSVTISGQEEFMNRGKSQVISLLQGKIQQLELSMQLELNRQLYADGTGNAGKDLTGLELAVENGAAWSVYGGIDSNTDTYWRNTWVDSTAATLGAFIGEMTTVYNATSRGSVRPELIVTNQGAFEQYERYLRLGSHLYPQENSLGEAGFQNLVFKGCPMVFTNDITNANSTTDAIMFFLTPEFMRFVLGKGKNFVITEFQKPVNQDAKVAQVLLFGNLTINNRARQGRLDGITTTITI